MESFRDDEKLAEALSALRPAPSIAFAAELDERVAAGFPRPEGSEEAPGARLGAWLRSLKPRQLLLPSAATAVLAIAVVTAVVASNQGAQTKLDGARPDNSTQAVPGTAAAPERGASEAGFLDKSSADAAGAEAKDAPSVSPSASDLGQREIENPDFFGASSGPRAVERSTEIVLGTDPDGVANATAKVFDAVHDANGIVLRSSSTSGSAGNAGAQFDLLIPSGRLDDALAAFSGIADVRSRHDGTVDITAPTVGAGERLQDSRARIDSLLKELAGSETQTAREAIEAQLRGERRESARLSAQLSALQERASFSRVSLRIVSDGSSSGSGGGSWDAGEAIGDAGHILAVAAGVTIVGLAILGPIALLALLLWLANRAWLRRTRERALG